MHLEKHYINEESQSVYISIMVHLTHQKSYEYKAWHTAHTLGYIAQIAGGTTAYIPRISQDGSRDCPDSIHDFFDGVEYTDTAFVHSISPTHVEGTAATKHSATKKTENRKHLHYDGMAQSVGAKLIPAVFDTYGARGEELTK